MKKLLLVFILFSALVSQAQIFAPPGAEWEYTGVVYGGISYGTTTMKYTGDTLINGIYCQKIKQVNPTSPWLSIYWEPCFYSTSDKIYYYNPVSNQFNLIYDYSLNIGDTMRVHRNSCSSFDRVVISKGTETINGVDYRYIEYPNSGESITNFNGRYYEKIGFLNSLFTAQPDCAPDGMYFLCLSKYSDNSSQTPLYNSDSCRAISTSIKENSTINFTLYPNPITNGTFTIQSGNNIKHIELIDMLGQNVLSSAPVGNTVTIGNIAQGLHVAKVVFANGKVGYKRVVVE